MLTDRAASPPAWTLGQPRSGASPLRLRGREQFYDLDAKKEYRNRFWFPNRDCSRNVHE